MPHGCVYFANNPNASVNPNNLILRVPNLHPEFISVVKRWMKSLLSLCCGISRYMEKAMTALVQELLDTFDRLTDSERLDLVVDILKRAVYLDF
jgi:hypothetical protein